MVVAIGHQETFAMPEDPLQSRVLIQALGVIQVQRCVAAQAVQAVAQGLAVLPQPGRVVGAVATVQHPALFLVVEQGQAQAGDVPVAGQVGELVVQHVRQAAQVAQADLLVDLRGKDLALLPAQACWRCWTRSPMSSSCSSHCAPQLWTQPRRCKVLPPSPRRSRSSTCPLQSAGCPSSARALPGRV